MTIAFWCVFVAVLLPYVCFGIARNRGRGPSGQRLRDNRNPRDFPNRIEAWPSERGTLISMLSSHSPALRQE